ncbi:hypothetical protein DLAC_04441 [Tieghemostelium lacteum]|uniref:F-box domain-containing protein n=1 Tax=Tieghemostelium lacteum TaxID=361077 RepID=A0A151ZJI1_TIELA|nr:hypothetical protein DLAC_04441 [Tieghemostelium lacteum]|eukprot:KYQ94152.1 hypothetical protein DLAC_04441 [Tieghemostelium lacteum]
MILPNHIVQAILEYLLNHSEDLKYLVSFIKRYTLISKQWNREIISKLRIKRSIVIDTTSNEMINTWIYLSDRYGVNYNVIYKKQDRNWNGSFRDKVIAIILDDVSSGDNELFSTYSNLKKVTYRVKSIDIKYMSLKLLEPQNDKYSYNIHAYGNYIYTGDSSSDNIQTSNPSITDILFGKNIFEKIGIMYCNIKFNLPTTFNNCQFSRLNDLSLNGLMISKLILSTVLEHSFQLKYLYLESITITPEDTFDWVLEKLIPLENLINIRINVNIKTNFENIISFLNHTKCVEISIQFGNIQYQSVSQVLIAHVDNHRIEQFNFQVIDGFTPMNDSLRGYTLLPRWKNKSNLKEITIYKPDISISQSLTGMVNLQSIYIHFNHTSTQESLNNIFELNLPSLEYFNIVSLDAQIPYVRTESLMMNRYLTALYISNVNYIECITILGCNHPTIIDITFHYLLFTKGDDTQELLNVLKCHQSLRHLQIYSSNIRRIENDDPITQYNSIHFTIEILRENRNYITLSLPPFSKINKSHISSLETVLSENHTIQCISLPFDLTLDSISQKQKKYHTDIIAIFNKYSILF